MTKSSLNVAGCAILLGAAALSQAYGADASHGEAIFKACIACHNDKPGALGPSLKGVYGRKAGALEDFRYSAAMKRTDLVWDEPNLKEYITNPQAKVKGNRMPFSGLQNPSDIDDVVAYLETLK